MRLRRLAALLVCGLAIPATARPDHLRFAEGGGIDLPSSVEGDDVLLDTPMGRLRFPRSDFSRIDPLPEPSREWPIRRAEALKGDPASRVSAVLWAIDHGLIPEAESLLRESPATDRSDPAFTRLLSSSDRLSAPLPDPDLAPLLRSAPAGHSLLRGPHILLIHQATAEEATERLAHLEAIVTGFYLSFAAMGLELPAPRSRLPAIWFARKADYLAALRGSDAEAFGNTRGYHHPTRGLVFSYDCRDDDPVRLAKQAMQDRRDELSRFARYVQDRPTTAPVRVALSDEPRRLLPRDEAISLAACLGRRLDRQEMIWELARREIDLGVAAHETVHQLTAASRLAPRADAFPTWLHEGLAMQFETIRAGRWAGLSTPSPIRLRDYRRLGPAPSLRSTLSDSRLRHGYDRDAYARAWSLVFFLRTTRPSEFLSLLDALRLPSSAGEGRSSPASRPILAEDDSLHLLESSWHERINGLASPTQSATPSPGFN